MIETIGVLVFFLVLLAVDWRYKIRFLRVGTAMLAMLVLVFFQPNYGAAARRISKAPEEIRVTHLRGSTVSDYESGVLTMLDAIDQADQQYASLRLLALGVLLYLACSPAGGRVGAADSARRG